MTVSGAFAYVAPGTVADAIAVLEQCTKEKRRAQVLAGGTDLLVQLRGQDRSPRTLIDIKKIADTTKLDLGRTETFIGAALSSAVLNENPALVQRFPGLLEAADLIGSTQIQGRATLGGNLCNASPAGDSIPAMIANGAICVIAGKNGTRELPVENFVVGVGRNALQQSEFLIGLKLPNPGPRTSDAYLRFIPRTEMDIAVAGCGVSLSFDAKGICTAARVAIGAVAPTALLVPAAAQALIGTAVDEAALQAAGAACSAAAVPITDKRGTEVYRRKVVGVLCRRAAAIARTRALA
ncbi:MAG: FAD binding domain-containing protein [Pseudomonadales bacterium]|nr:FAD binding domain-containing protein [Pseudomonadales bacterium]